MSLFEVVALDKHRKQDFLYQMVCSWLGRETKKIKNYYPSIGGRQRRRYTKVERCCALTHSYSPCKNKKLKSKQFCHIHRRKSILSFLWK